MGENDARIGLTAVGDRSPERVCAAGERHAPARRQRRLRPEGSAAARPGCATATQASHSTMMDFYTNPQNLQLIVATREIALVGG